MRPGSLMGAQGDAKRRNATLQISSGDRHHLIYATRINGRSITSRNHVKERPGTQGRRLGVGNACRDFLIVRRAGETVAIGRYQLVARVCGVVA